MGVCEMGPKRYFFIWALLAVCLTAFATTARADGRTTDATSFIQSLANETVAVLSDPTIADEERTVYFRDLLRRGFAVELMGRYAVGPNWRTMSPTQRQEYLHLFVEFALGSYASKLSGYSGESVEILKSVAAGDRDTLVRTRIVSAKGSQPIACDWRVRSIDGNPQVIDVMVEGMSLLVTQRAEFSAVLRKRGIEGLFELLREKQPDGTAQSVALAG